MFAIIEVMFVFCGFFFSCIVFSYVIHMIGSVLGIHLEKSIVEIVLVIHCHL